MTFLRNGGIAVLFAAFIYLATLGRFGYAIIPVVALVILAAVTGQGLRAGNNQKRSSVLFLLIIFAFAALAYLVPAAQGYAVALGVMAGAVVFVGLRLTARQAE